MRARKFRFLAVFLLCLAPLLAEDNLKYGQPACSGPVLDKSYFVVCYDPGHKIPTWVGYALTKDDASATAADRNKGNYDFKPDPALKGSPRAENADYAKSGYDKGHMAPANDFKRSVEALKATFVLTNSVPQRHGVNGGKWAEVEAAVHSLAIKSGTVWVFSGPVFAGASPMKTIGRDKVAVPTHTYKVVLCVHPDGKKEMFGFVLPNIEKPSGSVSDYTQSLRFVETLVGLDFFSSLPQ
ncbi:MAG: DNA/RNA non-specific endonuclease [Acidobacteriia bacterium]|nr:DNA/RNA non-specific endonuclease [Terriglobia bacterium]